MTPVHLITGPLGSGKTTLLRHLLTQKPPDEHWGILINDFGTLGIDAALVQADAVEEVAGGCLCCSAQLGLQQGLNRLLRAGAERIFIEASGVSHPQSLVMTLSGLNGITLRSIIAVVTPLQLTPERWRRAEPLRQLLSLADHVVINKTDLADRHALAEAERLLRSLPEPPHWQPAEQGRVSLPPLLEPPPRPLRILNADEHDAICPTPHEADLPGLMEASLVQDRQVLAGAWRFTPAAIFNRTRLASLLQACDAVRAKGLLRTGMAWNLLQLADGQLHWTPHGWCLDSRLVVFWSSDTPMRTIKTFERQLRTGMTLKEGTG